MCCKAVIQITVNWKRITIISSCFFYIMLRWKKMGVPFDLSCCVIQEHLIGCILNYSCLEEIGIWNFHGKVMPCVTYPLLFNLRLKVVYLPYFSCSILAVSVFFWHCFISNYGITIVKNRLTEMSAARSVSVQYMWFFWKNWLNRRYIDF